MQAINFVVRNGMGAVQRGQVGGEGIPSGIDAGSQNEISLNLRQGDVQGYQRIGRDLQIVLADGRVITLEDFYTADGAAANRLFISADGYLNEVDLVTGPNGDIFAQYGVTEQWGKWSPTDDLIFLENTDVAHVDSVVGAGDNEVSMLGAGLLGGSGLLPALGLGAAAVAPGIIGGGGGGSGGTGGGGGGGTVPIPATIDQDQPVIIGGDDVTDADRVVVISGTAEPGSTVSVGIGGKTIETTATPEGTWAVTFEGDTFPGDGVFSVTAVVTEPTGTVVNLTGPEVVVDTTPPDITVTDGFASTNDLTNAAAYPNGVTLSGTGEAGATMEVTIGGHSHTTTVSSSGTWTVTFLTTEIEAGEYTRDVTLRSTDRYGNSTTVTEAVVIDTVPHPIVIRNDIVETDGVVNAAENSDGVVITGTSTAGATVTVTLAGVSQNVVVANDGNWSASFDRATLRDGEYDATVTATTIDTAGNRSSVSETIRVDTVGSVAINPAAIEGDNIVNAAEAGNGVTLTGTSEPGSTVDVTFQGRSHQATVAANGNWTVDFAASEIRAGTYDDAFSVRAVDRAGNISTATRTVHVDTETFATINSGLSGGDNLVNGAEARQGVTLTGTAEPGSRVMVTMEGVTHPATVASNGTWSANFSSSEIRAGTYTAGITVVATDAAGNVQTVTGGLGVDTVGFVTVDTSRVEGDGIVNAVEARDGVTLVGTTEPGSIVNVTMNGVTRPATVGADGNWSANFLRADIPTGEVTIPVSVSATDPVGNLSTASSTLRIDTLVNRLDSTINTVEGDGVVNAAEAADGVLLSGTVEPGSTVSIHFGNTNRDYPATVSSTGQWSVTIPAGDLPAGEYRANVTVTAVDAAGNVADVTGSFTVDTTPPDSVEAASYTRDHTGIRGISVDGDTTVDVHQVAANGQIFDISESGTYIGGLDETFYSFSPTVADGSHLIVTTDDSAGNTTGTYLAFDGRATTSFDLSAGGLGAYQIETVDLQFADQAHLTINEAQLRALSTNSDTLVVHGGSDDTVTVTGAIRTGQTQQIDGQLHDIYTLGDTGVLMIDHDINVVI